MFSSFEPSVSGKPPAKVHGGSRDDEDDDGVVKPSGSWTAVSANSVAPIQFGQSVALVRDLSSLCCGAIGISGQAFCCADNSKTCPASHKTKRVEVLEARKATGAPAFYFVAGSTQKKLYVDPVLFVEGWPDQEIEEMLLRDFEDLDDWGHEVAAQDAALVRGLSMPIARASVAKPRLPKLSPSELDEDPTSSLTALFKNASVESPLKIEDAKAGTIVQQEWLSHATQLIGEAESRLRTEIKGVSDTLGMVQTEIGKPTSTRLLQAGHSIWTAIEKATPNVQALVSDAPSLEELQKAVFGNADFEDYLLKTKKAMDHLAEKVAKLELGANNSSSNSAGASLFGRFQVGGNQAGAPSTVDQDQATLIAKLEKKVADLEKAKNRDNTRGEITVVIRDKVITSVLDVRATFRVSASSAELVRPSLVHDAYTILDLVGDVVYGYLDSRNVAPDKAQRMNRSIKDLQHITSSTMNGLPNFFDSSKASGAGKIFINSSTKGSKASVFSNIPSYEVWGPVGTSDDCVRKRAESALDSIKLEFSHDTKEGVDPATVVLLDTMLNRAIEFVKAVFKFLTNEYETLKSYFSDGAKCWNFLCDCVKHVFTSEFHVARAVCRTADYQDRAGTNEKVIWTALRTLSIQEDFLRVGFENHPGLSSAYSRFMLTNMPNKAVLKLQGEMEVAVKKLKEVEAGVTKATGLANSAISKATAAGSSKKKKEGGT